MIIIILNISSNTCFAAGLGAISSKQADAPARSPCCAWPPLFFWLSLCYLCVSSFYTIFCYCFLILFRWVPLLRVAASSRPYYTNCVIIIIVYTIIS